MMNKFFQSNRVIDGILFQWYIFRLNREMIFHRSQEQGITLRFSNECKIDKIGWFESM